MNIQIFVKLATMAVISTAIMLIMLIAIALLLFSAIKDVNNVIHCATTFIG